MSKFIAYALAICLLSLAPKEAVAADGPSAERIASLVQSFYDKTKSLDASFYQTRYTRLYDRYDRASGRVIFKKPGRMRWDYEKPNGQIFIADGKRLSIYQPPEEGEKTGQLIERPVSDDQLPAAFSFLTGTGRLDRDFHFRLLDASNQGFENGYVLQLRPRKSSSHFEQVLFFVRVLKTQGKQAGVIQRVLIIDAAGNRNRFDFSDMKFNRFVSETKFNFEPPKGTIVVDP